MLSHYKCIDLALLACYSYGRNRVDTEGGVNGKYDSGEFSATMCTTIRLYNEPAVVFILRQLHVYVLKCTAIQPFILSLEKCREKTYLRFFHHKILSLN